MGSNNRDDFSLKTKDTLAKRVGYHCSNPSCQKPTSGPHSDPDKATNIGVAAHICAASPGGPRYDASMSSAERSSVKNGIWLCQTCSVLIDKDAKKYSTKTLIDWKDKAERAAELNKSTNRLSSKWRTRVSAVKRNPVFIILGLLIISILGAVIGNAIDKSNKSLNDSPDSKQFVSEQSISIGDISPEKASLLYETGMASYNDHQFGAAAKQFEDAIAEQEKITGVDSTDVGIVYCMLGLSRIYTGNTFKDDGNDAVSALTCAIQIFKQNNATFELALARFYLGTAYFESGEEYLNRAKEQVDNSITALKEYCPNPTPVNIFSVESSGFDNSPTSEDCESIYRSCRFYKLLQEDYNLLGKILSRRRDYVFDSFYYFNYALLDNSALVAADYALATCVIRDSDEINQKIGDYMQGRTPESILANTIDIKIYSTDVETRKFNPAYFKMKRVYPSDATATVLTNRAMSEVTLNHPEEAAEDCMTAISIWEQLPFSSRANISYAYYNLTLSHLIRAQASDDPLSYLQEIEVELKNYADAALTYDIEFFGETHVRTAQSYESKGKTYYIFGETEIAEQCFQEAKSIYTKWGYDEKAQDCEDMLKQINSE